MATATTHKFSPDYIVSPGDVLEETLDAREIKKSEFALRCNLSAKTVSLILSGKAPVTPETAIKFERVLDIPSTTWLNIESKYSLRKAEREAEECINANIQKLKKYPINELIKRKIIQATQNKMEQAKELLNFFSVGSFQGLENQIGSYSAYFRHSSAFKSTPEALSSWIRIAEVYADNLESELYDRNNFIKALKEIREMTNESPTVYIPEIKRLLKGSGVVFVIVPELKDVHLSGATKWISKNKALMILSLRHKTNDHFWFSFFHEAAHILLHGKKEIFIDEVKINNTLEEQQANKYASDILIPAKQYKIFSDVKPTVELIVIFADKINIAPGIVVGRLQHDEIISYNHMHGLKEKLDLSSIYHD
jgi:addiction module HigA family antidote